MDKIKFLKRRGFPHGDLTHVSIYSDDLAGAQRVRASLKILGYDCTTKGNHLCTTAWVPKDKWANLWKLPGAVSVRTDGISVKHGKVSTVPITTNPPTRSKHGSKK